jgi:hypothetical protein
MPVANAAYPALRVKDVEEVLDRNAIPFRKIPSPAILGHRHSVNLCPFGMSLSKDTAISFPVTTRQLVDDRAIPSLPVAMALSTTLLTLPLATVLGPVSKIKLAKRLDYFALAAHLAYFVGGLHPGPLILPTLRSGHLW